MSPYIYADISAIKIIWSQWILKFVILPIFSSCQTVFPPIHKCIKSLKTRTQPWSQTTGWSFLPILTIWIDNEKFCQSHFQTSRDMTVLILQISLLMCISYLSFMFVFDVCLDPQQAVAIQSGKCLDHHSGNKWAIDVNAMFANHVCHRHFTQRGLDVCLNHYQFRS